MSKRRTFGGMMTAGFLIASIAMSAAKPATPPTLPTGNIRPASGEVDPLYGNIRAFSGALNPLYGNIRAFWGDISPFYGNIRAFWGTANPVYANIATFDGNIDPSGGGQVATGSLNPFYGNIRAFNGDLQPLYGNIRAFEGGINPLYGNIRAFAGDMRPFYGNIRAFWDDTGAFWSQTDAAWAAAGTDATKYPDIGARLQGLVDRSNALWGPAVNLRTGLSFADGFANPMFAKWGINPGDPNALMQLSEGDRQRFFLDWYDGLMDYAGVDHVDYWMHTVNWTPAITQIAGGSDGAGGARVGLLDFYIAGDPDVRSKVTSFGGVSTFSNGHGAGVASLIVASQDGKGVLGIAPNSTLAVYSPYDATGTANWTDVTTGLAAITQAGTSVVNMSLGVPGWTLHPKWADVFADPSIASSLGHTVFVVAAGNDGITQASVTAAIPVANGSGGASGKSGNGNGNGNDKGDGSGKIKDNGDQGNGNNSAINPALIVVGSVDPSGKISSFSNRPGDACAFDPTGKCGPDGLLRNIFIVAPGELLLVADDHGGIHRMSGTSFAAPLVTGAIALLQDRWPWLKNYPRETVDIILRSAKHLGDSGTGPDPVYGRGLLDITASQSPLDLNALTYYQVVGDRVTPRKVSDLRKTNDATRTGWEASGASFYAFEGIGKTSRDFVIPLSSKLVGKTATYGDQQYFQSYMSSRMIDWTRGVGFTDQTRVSSPLPGQAWTLTTTTAFRPVSGRQGVYLGQVYGVVATSAHAGLSFGNGDGAIALSGPGFGLSSDHDPQSGGANPLLGFASGGTYASADLALTPRLRLTAGLTEQREKRLRTLAGPLDLSASPGLRPYAATATHIAALFSASERLRFGASYTSLREDSGLLGLQSLDATDLAHGSRSDALTMTGDLAIGHGLALATTATVSRTIANAGGQNLGTSGGGLLGSAFQMALTKNHVFGGSDRARFSLAQPLHLEGGAFTYRSVQVIDRATGDIGLATTSFGARDGGRRFIAEALYARAMLRGTGEVSAFGRGELTGKSIDNGESFTLGGRINLRF